MPSISVFNSPRPNIGISSGVQGASIDTSGAGAIERAYSGVASDVNQLATRLIEEETNHQAKIYAWDRGEEKDSAMLAEYEKAVAGYDPVTSKVHLQDESGNKVDTGLNIHQYLKEKSELFDLSIKEEVPSLQAERAWDMRSREVEGKYLIQATGAKIAQDRTYKINSYDMFQQGVSKSLERKQGSLTNSDIIDGLNRVEEAYATLDPYTDYATGSKTLRDSKDSIAGFGLDTLIDGKNLAQATTALLLTDDSASPNRKAEAKALRQGVIDKYIGKGAKFKSIVKDGNDIVMMADDSQGVRIQDDGTVTTKGYIKPLGNEVIFTEAIGIQGTYKLDSTIYDAMTDDTYARSIDRLNKALEDSKKETTQRAIKEQQGLVAMLLDPRESTRATLDLNNPSNPTTASFERVLGLIQGSAMESEDKEIAQAELLAAASTGKLLKDIKFSSPSDVNSAINNLDNIVDRDLAKIGIEVPDTLKAKALIAGRTMLEKFQADKMVKAQTPDFYISENRTVGNAFAKGLENGQSMDKYVDSLNNSKDKVGVSRTTPLLPKSYSQGLVKQLTELSKADTAGVAQAQATVKELRNKWGNNFSRVWTELVEEGMPDSFRFVGSMDSTPEGDRAAMRMVSNGAQAKQIEDLFKGSSGDSYNDFKNLISTRVSDSLAGFKNYSTASSYSGARDSLAMTEAIELEAKRLLSTKSSPSESDAKDAVDKAYHTYINRNFVTTSSDGYDVFVGKGLLQTAKISEPEFKNIVDTYSDLSNISSELNLDKLISSRVKEDLVGLGATDTKPFINKSFESGAYGNVVPTFTSQGLAFRFIPANGAPAFYLMDGKNKMIIKDYESVKRDPKVISNGKTTLENLTEAADEDMTRIMSGGR